MAGRGFVPDRRFIDRLARTPEIAAVAVSAAERGREWAQANAPRDSGTYARAFEVEPMAVSVSGKRRAGAALINTASRTQGGRDYPYAWAVEWGQAGKHILQRAIDAIEKG